MASVFLSYAVLILTLTFGRSYETDVCVLVDEPMYCTCDQYGHNVALRASCSAIKDITNNDLVWNGFDLQLNLRELTLSFMTGTRLDGVPTFVLQKLAFLEKFEMHHSRVETLWPFTFVNMSKLETLLLDRNHIEVLEAYSFSYLPNLKLLELGQNRIKRLSAETLYRMPKLEKLSLEKNIMSVIGDLAFVELPNLVQLDLSSNHLHQLTSKTFVGLRSLKRLDLSKNNLTSLSNGVFSAVRGLEELHLSSNHIHNINLHTLDGLKHLKILELHQNDIQHLEDNFFKGTVGLEFINLSHNRLQSFPRKLVDPLKLDRKHNLALHLKGNPLDCSCDLLWLSDYTAKVRDHQLRKELRQLKCYISAPVSNASQERDLATHNESTHHVLLFKVTANDLSCPEEVTTQETIPPTTTSTTKKDVTTKLLPSSSAENLLHNDNFVQPNFYAEKRDAEGKSKYIPQVTEPKSTYKRPVMAASRQNAASPRTSSISTLVVFLLFSMEALG